MLSVCVNEILMSYGKMSLAPSCVRVSVQEYTIIITQLNTTTIADAFLTIHVFL